MTNLNNADYLLHQQYNNAAKLNARTSIHARFSTNTYGWFRWVFDQYDPPAGCHILELGCGSGELWRSCLDRIPAGWQMTLSDFSQGMVDQARQNLEGARPFKFEVINAQSIPYPDGAFDAVIANHMLYHVPDRPKALAEIRRVLKPGCKLYATTIGSKHMRELYDLVERFAPGQSFDRMRIAGEFSLETGPAQLEKVFSRVEVRRYPDSLHVTEAAPMVDYIYSTYEFGQGDDWHAKLTAFIEQEMEMNGGAIEITKNSGVLIAE